MEDKEGERRGKEEEMKQEHIKMLASGKEFPEQVFVFDNKLCDTTFIIIKDKGKMYEHDKHDSNYCDIQAPFVYH